MLEKKPWLFGKTNASVISSMHEFDPVSLQLKELCIERAEAIKYANIKKITMVVYRLANNCLPNLLHY